jgi:hypothetical protein
MATADLDALLHVINEAGIPGTFARVYPNGTGPDGADAYWLCVYGGPDVARISVTDSGDVGMHTGPVNWPAIRVIDRHLHADAPS